ncbi:MAG: alpha-glucosidase/alpha-galactosidase [Clostridia bacterium]|nr:alpha-glucosidase/alpha-galactosidase [Clostridia bacterium]
MSYQDNCAKDVKIAYIGGGSRGWAWTLMKDLAKAEDVSGSVYLYDIDFEAAKNNETIGNRIEMGEWKYVAAPTIGEALTGADFVIVSILPGTFDEMESDVHAPEKYDVYQPVGDTTGPGGFFRSLRTVPMMQEIARAVREFCPKAWVINYTNPMAVCVHALYKEFPEIKAFGCCHEVFGTQKLLAQAFNEFKGEDEISLEHGEDDYTKKVCVNVIGVNHFTWLTSARYKNYDLFPIYTDFARKYHKTGYVRDLPENWMNNAFKSAARVRLDLFLKYGYIAAAGDRHLVEFMDKEDYLYDPANVRQWSFGLTTVAWRKNDLKERLEKSKRLLSGEEKFEIKASGEEGVRQIRALLGLGNLVTNVNLPNYGQIPNLPLGTVVETNAAFRNDSVQPVCAGEIPAEIYPLISRIAEENNETVEVAFARDLKQGYEVFAKGHLLKTLNDEQKRELFATMYENTKEYLTEYKA